MHDSSKPIKIFRKLLFGFTLLISTLILGCMYLAFGNPPKPIELPNIEGSDVKYVSNSMKRISKKLNKNPQKTQIYFSEQELNSLFVLAHQANPEVAARSKIENSRAQVDISFPLVWRNLKIRIFVSAAIGDSDQSIRWKKFKIGSLPLSNFFANTLFRLAFSYIVGRDYAHKMLNGLDKITIKQNKIYVSFVPPTSFEQNVGHLAKQLRFHSGNHLKLDEPQIRKYLTFIAKRANSTNKLGQILSVLLTETGKSTITDSRLHADENIAAFTALGIYTEPQLFRHVVDKDVMDALSQMPSIAITLNGRSDLARHFIVSAILKLLTDTGISEGIGEFKELLDSLNGGSGFSFIDLAADRAGILFAQVLYDYPEQLHELVSQKPFEDRDILPLFSQLDEGLTHSSFKQKYTNTSSKKYKRLIQNIDARLNLLPIYKLISKG